MLSVLSSATVFGISAVPVQVEVDVSSRGLPGITIVGLPNPAVQESKERVRTVLRNLGFSYRAKKVLINLSPASIPKQGPAFDLPIAVGLMQAYGLIPPLQQKYLFYGELALDGSVKPTLGTFNVLLLACQQKVDGMIFPFAHVQEAVLLNQSTLHPIKHIREVVDWVVGKRELPVGLIRALPTQTSHGLTPVHHVLETYWGQPQALRTAAVSSAGKHHLLLIGPPGTGKSMLAQAIPHLLPVLDQTQAIETAAIYSSQGLNRSDCFTTPPFRSPHHTTSLRGLLGGGTPLKAGELSLAHNGTLFLDELPLFSNECLQSLLVPLESGTVTHMYKNQPIILPTKTLLITAMNPCPCGHANSKQRPCACSPHAIGLYRRKISGPLLDRIDLLTYLDEFTVDTVSKEKVDVEAYIKTIHLAQQKQKKRYEKDTIRSNGELTSEHLDQYFQPTKDARTFFNVCCSRLSISARKYVAIARVARTVADMESEEFVEKKHIAEAMQLCVRTL